MGDFHTIKKYGHQRKKKLFQRKKKKRSNSEINVPDITQMFHRQAENGQQNEQKDNNKVIVIIENCNLLL